MNKAAAALDTQADVSSFNGKPQATVNPAIRLRLRLAVKRIIHRNLCTGAYMWQSRRVNEHSEFRVTSNQATAVQSALTVPLSQCVGRTVKS